MDLAKNSEWLELFEWDMETDEVWDFGIGQWKLKYLDFTGSAEYSGWIEKPERLKNLLVGISNWEGIRIKQLWVGVELIEEANRIISESRFDHVEVLG